MEQTRISVGQAAKILGVSIQTLRRWDQDGILEARRQKEGGNRFYLDSDLNETIENGSGRMDKMAMSWVQSQQPWEPLKPVYCSNSTIFQFRLHAFEQQLANIQSVAHFFQLISAVTGEIGNNSFDHNLGNWPDIPGIFFGHDPARKQVILTDRGQGVLTTLKRVRPNLKTHKDALRIAFTEVVSARAPENRGNGLKFVRHEVQKNKMRLFFQTGNAITTIEHKTNTLTITLSKHPIQGCLAILTYDL